MINIVDFFKPCFLKSIEKYVFNFIIHLSYEDYFSIKISKNVKYKDMIEILTDAYEKIHKEIFQYTWPTYIFKELSDKEDINNMIGDYYINISHELWDSGIFVVNATISDNNLFKKVIEVKRYNNGWI